MNEDTQPSDDPRLNYTGQSDMIVNADYFDMPDGAQIVVVDETSGVTLDNSGTLLYSGGTGKVSVAIDDSTPAGAYHLAALDAAGDATIAQTVVFYITDRG